MNNSPSPVDLTEACLDDMMKQISASGPKNVTIQPKRAILPPWIVAEIEEQYGKPATEAKYHLWNMKRLNLGKDEYFKLTAIASLADSE